MFGRVGRLRRRLIELSEKEENLAVLLLMPVVLYLLISQGFPLILSLVTSLTDKRIGMPGRLAWFQNFSELAADPIFRIAIRNTVLFTLGAIVMKLVGGTVMALVLNYDGLVGKNLWRALLFLPWTIPSLVTTLTWRWILTGTGGIANYLLLKSGIIRFPIDWLGNPKLALISIILVNVWRGTPFFGISLLGAMQTISPQLYEAAEVDGASRFRKFASITLPSIAPIIAIVTLVSTIWTLNDFDIIWMLTRGGPSNRTQVFSTLAYTTGFLNLRLGKAQAVSVYSLPLLMFLVILVTKKMLSEEQ